MIPFPKTDRAGVFFYTTSVSGHQKYLTKTQKGCIMSLSEQGRITQ